ncbi:MAG: TadE/TadG family protein [Terrabacter sp.]|nr:TadE/TadG family protein [Terrabacter sp.]
MKHSFFSFLRDIKGNVLPMAAIGMLLSAALVGGGVDMSRAYRVENRLQSACDSAALAGRRAVASNGFDTTAQTQANSYFTTNFDDTTQETTSTTKSFTSADNGQTVTGTASTQLNLAVMKIFGFQKFSLAVTCQASMGVGNSDVVMVLDTTGSMGYALGTGTRISALRTAMKNFYTTVKTATTGTSARVRYGFVPFSTTVNVGHLLYDKDPNYLVDSYHVQSRVPVTKYKTTTSTTFEYKNETYTTPTKYSTTAYDKQSKCNNASPNDISWQSNGSPTITTSTVTNGSVTTVVTTTKQPQQATFYTCQKEGSNYFIYTYGGSRDLYTYSTVATDTSIQLLDYFNYKERKDGSDPLPYDQYKSFNAVTLPMMADDGSDVTSTWSGCIEERGTVSEPSFTYSTTNGMTPSGSNDLDLDSAPTSDDTTKWAPMWPQVAYFRTTSGGSKTNNPTSLYGQKANSYCPYRSQLLTEMTQTSFNAYADALNATGSTYLDIGMIWGGRLSSPDGIFSDTVNAAPSNGGEVSRHIIFMTDGFMEPDYDIQQAYGIEYHDRRITDDGSSNDANRHTSRFLAVCEAIKAKGIRVWAIAFTSGSTSGSNLQTCASPNSYYSADESAALNTAFQEIAKQVGELRITQ